MSAPDTQQPDVEKMRRECELALDPSGPTLHYADGNQFYRDVLALLAALAAARQALERIANGKRRCGACGEFHLDPRAEDLQTAARAALASLPGEPRAPKPPRNKMSGSAQQIQRPGEPPPPSEPRAWPDPELDPDAIQDAMRMLRNARKRRAGGAPKE